MEFRFAYPLVLIILLLPVFLYRTRWRPERAALRYSDTRLLTNLPKSWRIRLRRLPDMLRLLAWVLLVIALARPQSGQVEDIIRGKGIDIVLTVDISTSMAALDFEPRNRLAAAKTVIADFIAGRAFDRMGLVVFARNAYHHAPLTLDYAILLRLLDDIRLVSELEQPSDRRLDGTALGQGIASAANMLRGSSAPSKVIILLTDGANNAGLDPMQAASAASVLGIRVYTIGIGHPGLVDIPAADGTIQTIESDLDEDVLADIAARADGLYFRAEDTAGLLRIYDQIDTLERSDAERRIFVRWQDYIGYVLPVALVLLLLERLLRHTLFQTIP